MKDVENFEKFDILQKSFSELLLPKPNGIGPKLTIAWCDNCPKGQCCAKAQKPCRVRHQKIHIWALYWAHASLVRLDYAHIGL